METEKRLANLEDLAKNSLDEIMRPRIIEHKRRNSSSGLRLTEMTARITKLRRKMFKVTTNKQLNEPRILEEECKKTIHYSIENQQDCYDVKVFKVLVEKLHQKIEDIKKNREELEDNEVAQEIFEDLESSLATLQIIASNGEKLELAMTGKPENLEQFKACIEALKKLKGELLDILEALRVQKKDLCARLEDMKIEIGSIRSGLDNLSSLLRFDNLGLDEPVISFYEQATKLHGWLGESLLRLFEDLVVVTRVYEFLAVISE